MLAEIRPRFRKIGDRRRRQLGFELVYTRLITLLLYETSYYTTRLQNVAAELLNDATYQLRYGEALCSLSPHEPLLCRHTSFSIISHFNTYIRLPNDTSVEYC
jgi:hypothetical protein